MFSSTRKEGKKPILNKTLQDHNSSTTLYSLLIISNNQKELKIIMEMQNKVLKSSF